MDGVAAVDAVDPVSFVSGVTVTLLSARKENNRFNNRIYMKISTENYEFNFH